MKKNKREDDRWTDEDLATIWYMLYQNSMNSNVWNRGLVTKRYCQYVGAKERKSMWSLLQERKTRNGK